MMTSTQERTPLPIPQNKGCSLNLADFEQKLDLVKLLQPETSLEKKLLEMEEIKEGMNWGKPRFGHPEGKVGLHIKEVLANIDQLTLEPDHRTTLRLLAIVHDTFKFQEMKTFAEGKRIHHGKIARDFMRSYTNDIPFLEILEFHDEAFYIWRQLELQNQPEQALPRLQRLVERLGDALPLYFLFFKCDTETGDKVLAPLTWFDATVKGIADEKMNRFIANSL